MAKQAWHFPSLIERTLPWGVLAILLTFTYAFFWRVPYAGFMWNSSSGQVFEIYVPPSQNAGLQVEDRLIQVGPTTLTDFRSNLRQTLFDGLQPGDVVQLHIQRGNDPSPMPVDWIFPGFTLNEALVRLDSQWWLAYVFWFAGTLTLFTLRPKDMRWRLLIAFNFLTALWLAAGSGVSRSHIWESAFVLRSAVWLCLPVYLHLHWAFPQPLGRLPAWIPWSLYLVAVMLAIAEWFQVLPTGAYSLGFLLAAGGSGLLLATHFILKPEERRDIRLLVTIGILALIPSIFISIATAFSKLPPLLAGGAFLILPFIPLGYLRAVSRHQLGELALRANRLISLYLFFFLVSVLLFTLISLAEGWLGFPRATNLMNLIVALITLVAIFGFGPFQRLIERRLLSAPWPLEQLVETYAERITTSLDMSSLVKLLSGEVLPSLLIRQSALLRCEADRLTTVIYLHAVEANRLPADADLLKLLAEAGKYRAPAEAPSLPYAWVRLILPLFIGSELIGLWLLGRRDPDDFYAQTEITTLRALAHQTAIALTNIVYAEQLLALYQTSIDQREAERASLGRDLHDDILRRLFALQEHAGASMDSPPFVEAYEEAIYSVRHVIRGLRPPMLEYGLYRALEALTDDWARRPDSQRGPVISFDVLEADLQRYAPHAELHLSRIVQQAGENAIQHARAETLKIYGRLAPDQVDLTIEDDGQGFEVHKMLDLARPEARSHFGLIGMRERAALINAQISFDSAPGQGARVHLKWCPENSLVSVVKVQTGG